MVKATTALSLRGLEYALAVADLGHFGRAASRCGVSQPGLSEQVAKLEATLGVPLFERGRGGVHPTRAGTAVLKQAAVVLREAEQLLRMAHNQGGALSGPLELGVIPTLGPYYVPALLHDLRDRFPDLELRLQENRTAMLTDALRRYALDAALVALPVGETEGLDAAPLFFEPFRLLLPAGHRLEALAPVPTAALDGRELLLLDEGHCLRDQAVSLCRVPAAAGGAAERVASSLEMLRHMVAAREGIALMPALATGDSSALHGLVSLRPLREPDAGRTIGLVWRSTDPRGNEFRRLAAVLREHAPAGVEPVDEP